MQGHLDTNRIAARGNSQEVSTYLGPESIRASLVGGFHCIPVLSDGRAVLLLEHVSKVRNISRTAKCQNEIWDFPKKEGRVAAALASGAPCSEVGTHRRGM